MSKCCGHKVVKYYVLLCNSGKARRLHTSRMLFRGGVSFFKSLANQPSSQCDDGDAADFGGCCRVSGDGLCGLCKFHKHFIIVYLMC